MTRAELEQVERALRDAPQYVAPTPAQAEALVAAYAIIHRELAAPEPSGWREGAEAMREAAAALVNHMRFESDERDLRAICARIRSLPLPAPKGEAG
jgi:hypothetical protein